MSRSRFRQILFIVGDTMSLLLGFMIVFAIRKRTPFFPPLQDFWFYRSFLWVYIVAFIGFFSAFHLYDKNRPHFSLSYLADYIRAILSWSAVVIGFAFLVQANYSRVLLLYALVPGAVLPFISHLLIVRLLPQSTVRREEEDIAKIAHQLIRFNQTAPEELDLIEGFERIGRYSFYYDYIKRCTDLIFSFIGLCVVLLLCPFIAIAIIWNSAGPVVFSQDRVGKDGKLFKMYKFRTMRSSVSLYEPGPMSENDPRVTKVGRFLRHYSLDELPQLWNVLRGEMSLVGPRPEMPFLAAQHNDWQKERLSVKPGITGLWQILGRKDIPLSENLEYDFYYIKHRSFLLDLVIMLKTIPAIVLGRGAY